MIYFDSCYLAKLYLMEPDLACALEAGLREIYSSDRHLIAAAPHFGLRPVTLEAGSPQARTTPRGHRTGWSPDGQRIADRLACKH